MLFVLFILTTHNQSGNKNIKIHNLAVDSTRSSSAKLKFTISDIYTKIQKSDFVALTFKTCSAKHRQHLIVILVPLGCPNYYECNDTSCEHTLKNKDFRHRKES